ncbi:MAG: hypothetical protein MJZ92_03720 [Paludibacteraceae bacterium]|nr:hypothetical protein [Paludibacteraceae bacterium]
MLKQILHIVSRAREAVAMGILAICCLCLSLPVMANPDYVKFTALVDGSRVDVINSYRDPSINLQYSTDNGATWQNASPNASTKTINLSKDQFVLFRGTNPKGLNTPGTGSRLYITFKTAGQIEVSGDIMSLVDWSSNIVEIVPGDGCFYRLFQGSTALVSTKNLKLSSKYTSKASYNEMFNGCSALQEGPDMSSIESIEEAACQKMFYGCIKLKQTSKMSNLVVVYKNGCQQMYQGCTSLSTADELVAKYVDEYSYSSMFNGCTALKEAPKIDAYEMRSHTCSSMFKGCSSLEYSPDLETQFLDESCYESMFEDCKALKKAPVLKAISLYYEYGNKKINYTSCYKWMFKGCTALREIEVYFSDWRNTDPMPTGVWIMGVTETTEAVFKCPCGLPEKRGENCYIPNKWQRECFNFYLFDVYSNDAVWADDHNDYNNRALKESEISAIPQAYKDKHKFIGWNTKADGSGTMFSLSNKPDTTTTYYAIFESVVPVTPDVNCLNYSDLTASGVQCDTSSLIVKQDQSLNDWGNWIENETIDYGPRNRMSQQTIHHHPAEVDIHTDGKLHTACSNGKPSVRIGNWSKKQRERITYTYHVPDDEDAKILLLHYSAVLENPENHKEDEQPRFMLELFEEGKTIESCFQFNYISGNISTDPTWHTERGNICWKDWTTSGINLEQYKGHTIKIRLTTYDCRRSGHFGYAYFGLECSNGELKTISCGDQKEFKAPDGFNYAWYEGNTPGTILSTEQIFSLPQDKPGTYFCKVSNPEHPEPECSFNLKAVVEERSAIAEFDTLPRVMDGKNSIFYVTNTSHTSIDAGDFPDSCAWALYDAHNNVVSVSDELEPAFTINTNGTYTLTLVTYLKGKEVECPSTPATKQIVVGVKGSYEEIKLDTALCAADVWNGWIGHSNAIKLNETTYVDTIFTTVPPIDTTVYVLTLTRQKPTTAPAEIQSITKGQTYTWRGRVLSEQGMYYDTLYYNKTNCDSVYFTLNLVIEQPKCHSYMATVSVDSICANASAMRLILQPTDGKALRYSITFDDNAKQQGFVDVPFTNMPIKNEIIVNLPKHVGDTTWYVRPNDYSLTLNIEDTCGTPNTIVVPFTVLYPSWLILQRWNDVLALYNQDYNGHYDFANIQWYHKGNNISGRGEHNSYIYTKDYGQETLEFGTPYWAELTRTDDGKTIRTCYCYPAYQRDDVEFSDQPNKVEVRHSPSDKRTLYIDTELSGRFEMYHVSGTHIASGEFDDDNKHIDAHDYMPGTYVIVFIFNDGTIEPKRIVLN